LDDYECYAGAKIIMCEYQNCFPNRFDMAFIPLPTTGKRMYNGPQYLMWNQHHSNRPVFVPRETWTALPRWCMYVDCTTMKCT